MHRIIVAGSGTDVGKTIVAAILTTLFKGDYWKPIQCGNEEDSDTATMRKLIDVTKHQIHLPAYSLKSPLSPHHAALLDNVSIDLTTILPPKTKRPLIIESVGGILVPLTPAALSIDLFKTWNAPFVVVSKHYLGSINHTLLTLDTLKHHNIPLLGLIFNGQPNPDSEKAILEFSKVPCLGRLLPEDTLDTSTIQRYAQAWYPHFSQWIL